jgi:hypothetical protein
VNRWTDVEAAIVRFVNAKDLDKKLRYLSAFSLPSPPGALSQPSGVPTTPQEPMYEGRTFVEWQADLGDPSPAVREKAALALGHFGPKAVPILTQTLRDSDADVRWAAADALGRIGPAAKDAVAALVQALKDPIRIVQKRAEIALVEIYPPALVEWQRAEREESRLRWEAAQRQAQQQRPTQSQEIEQVIATIIQEGTSSNPFGGIRIGKTPDEVARQYIEAFKARDVPTLIGLNHDGALEQIAKIKRDYYPASWEHHLRNWGQGYVKSLFKLFNETPKKFMTGLVEPCAYSSRLNGARCWDHPEFIAVGALTYEIEKLDMKRVPDMERGDVVEVPVTIVYPPGSLIKLRPQRIMKEASVYIDVSNNSVVGFFVWGKTYYDKP